MATEIQNYSYQNYDIELNINIKDTLVKITDINSNKLYQCKLNETFFNLKRINKIIKLFKKTVNFEPNYVILFKKSFVPSKNANVLQVTLSFANDIFDYEEDILLDETEVKEEFECTCCYNIIDIKKLIMCDIGHFVCLECYKTCANDIIFTNFNYKIKCLNTNEVCNCIIDERILKRILDRKVYEQLVKNRLKEDVKTINIQDINLYQCTNCEYYFDNNSGEKVFTCPECKKSICLECKKEPHIGKPCDFQRLEQEERFAREALCNYLNCRCGKTIERNGGCQFMRCVCGNTMCWICKQNIPDHNHAGIVCVPRGIQ